MDNPWGSKAVETTSVSHVWRRTIADFVKAYKNILIFLPYYFSVGELLRTLFAPWRRLVSTKNEPGFSFSEYFSNLSFNLISRWVGFFIRSLVLFMFVLAELFLILLFPVALGGFVVISLILVLNRLRNPPYQRYLRMKEHFVATHTLDPRNKEIVAKWFDFYFKNYVFEKPWWSLERLYSLQPLAKNWTSGYTVHLDAVSQELTTPSYVSRITAVVDHEEELKKLQEYLTRDRGGNVIIFGEPGVGKHTIIDGFVRLLWGNKVLPPLLYKRVLKLDIPSIFARFADQARRKALFKFLLREAERAGNVILVIDHIEEYLSPQSPYNIKTELMEFINSNNVHIIGITTTVGWQMIYTQQPELKKLFNELYVKEIPREKAFGFLLSTFWVYERRYKIILPYETLHELVDLADSFVSEIPYPEKVYKLLEEVISYALARGTERILPQHVKEYIESKFGIKTDLTDQMKEKLANIEQVLKQRILSQDQAIESIAIALRRTFLNIRGRKRPLASFLFLGPTGVGKTETAKALAEVFFGSRDKLSRIDLGFFQREEDLPKLIGDVTKGIPGELVEKVRLLRFGVLLLDELEKAHKKVFNTLLTLLDEGYIVDVTGKRVDCRYLFVIATSNAGYELYTEREVDKDTLIRYLIEKKIFAPEFLNRFDDVILFNALPFDTIVEIARRKVRGLIDKYKRRYGVDYNVSDEQLRKLLVQSQWKRFGAREIDRVLLKNIEAKILDMIYSRK